MLSLYVIALSCFIFVFVQVIYGNYISKKDMEIRSVVYNTILMTLSIFGSFELLNKVLPSIGINILQSAQQGGKGGGLNVFTNEPSF